MPKRRRSSAVMLVDVAGAAVPVSSDFDAVVTMFSSSSRLHVRAGVIGGASRRAGKKTQEGCDEGEPALGANRHSYTLVSLRISARNSTRWRRAWVRFTSSLDRPDTRSKPSTIPLGTYSAMLPDGEQARALPCSRAVCPLCCENPGAT